MTDDDRAELEEITTTLDVIAQDIRISREASERARDSLDTVKARLHRFTGRAEAASPGEAAP